MPASLLCRLLFGWRSGRVGGRIGAIFFGPTLGLALCI